MTNPTIETPRLWIRPLTQRDVTARYQSWLHDWGVNAYLETRFHPPTLAEVNAYVAMHDDNPSMYLWGVFIGTEIDVTTAGEKMRRFKRVSPHTHIGNIRLSGINLDHGYADNLSYFIGEKDYQRRGLATEAVKAVSDWGMTFLHRIEAGAQESHVATQRVLEKAGFTHETTMASKMRHPETGEWEGQRIYVRIAE